MDVSLRRDDATQPRPHAVPDTVAGQALRGAGFVSGPGRPGLVSVIIPTYNRGYIIAGTIDSVLAQTYADVEIIVVDDGSSDGTADIVSRYGPKVLYIHQKNAGVCEARNTGLRAAQGEFIALLDSDDHWLPWKLAAQIAVLRARPEVGMVWTDMTAVDAAGRELHKTYLRKFYHAYQLVRIDEVLTSKLPLQTVWPEANEQPGLDGASIYSGDLFSAMILGNLVHTSTVLLRRDRLRAAGPFDTQLRHSGEDYEFHLRTSYFGPVALIDAPCILYRVGAEDQLTQPRYAVHIAANNLATVRSWTARGAGRITLPAAALKQRLAGSHAWLGSCHRGLGNHAAAFQHLGRSFMLAPRLGTLRELAINCLPVKAQDWVRTVKRRLSPTAPMQAE